MKPMTRASFRKALSEAVNKAVDQTITDLEAVGILKFDDTEIASGDEVYIHKGRLEGALAIIYADTGHPGWYYAELENGNLISLNKDEIVKIGKE